MMSWNLMTSEVQVSLMKSVTLSSSLVFEKKSFTCQTMTSMSSVLFLVLFRWHLFFPFFSFRSVLFKSNVFRVVSQIQLMFSWHDNLHWSSSRNNGLRDRFSLNFIFFSFSRLTRHKWFDSHETHSCLSLFHSRLVISRSLFGATLVFQEGLRDTKSIPFSRFSCSWWFKCNLSWEKFH